MSAEASRGIRVGLAAFVLLLAIIGAQALAAISAPPGEIASANAMLGRTGFEYLGGLRQFAAAALWNRLEPQFHEYGNGKSIDQRLDFLPTIRLVQMLDPQFQQAYYVSAFMLARIGRIDTALEIAREGIKNNPAAGLMRANYVQILLIQDSVKNLPEALKQTREALKPGITWANTDDQYEGYGIFRAVFTLAGDTAAANKVSQVQQSLGSAGAGLGVERDE